MSNVLGCSQMWACLSYRQCPAVSQDILSLKYFVAATIYLRMYYLSLNGSIHLAWEYPVTLVWITCLGNWVYMYMGVTKFTMIHVDYSKRFITYALVTVMLRYRKRCLWLTAYTIFPQIKDWSTIFSSLLTPGLVFRHAMVLYIFKPFTITSEYTLFFTMPLCIPVKFTKHT